MALKIIIEGSRTPIYRRIINGLARSIEKKHNRIIILDPNIEPPLEFIRRINEQKPDLVIITNLFGLLSRFNPAERKYGYELLGSPVVFLHYDNPLGPINDWDEIERRLKAWVSISDRSSHFCIEGSNSADLSRLSIQNVHSIFHATEFGLVNNGGKYRYDLSFVGHLLPESILMDGIDSGNLLDERVLSAYQRRRKHLDYRIETDAMSFADLSVPSMDPAIDWLTAKQVYRARINGTSLYLRGSIITEIAENFEIDVIGGDPSYINNQHSTRQLEHPGVHIHTPEKDHRGTDRTYAESRININITSIQFDSAIVNRVLDVAAVGGFLLTDWKEDLKEITTVHEQISYRTVDELKDKIDYYLRHEAERLEIAAQLHQDVMQKRTYNRTAETILGTVLAVGN